MTSTPPHALTRDESVALAKLQAIEGFTLKCLDAAWWLVEHGVPPSAHHVARRLNARLFPVQKARDHLTAIHVWPALKSSSMKDEPEPEAIEPLPDKRKRPPMPSARQTDETLQQAAARCIDEFNRSWRRLFAGRSRNAIP
jgi:hypothetical protein